MHYQSVTSFFFYMYEFFLLLHLTELSRGEKFCRNISSLSSSNWVASMNLPQQIANPLESWFHKVKKCLLWFSCKILAMLSCFIFTYLCNLFHNAFVLHFQQNVNSKTVLWNINLSAKLNPVNFQAFLCHTKF